MECGDLSPLWMIWLPSTNEILDLKANQEIQRRYASNRLTATLWGAFFDRAIEPQSKNAPQRVAVKQPFLSETSRESLTNDFPTPA